MPVRIQISGSANGLANYIAAVEGAGGTAVAAYAPEPDLTCGGLLLSGGGDLDPALYGQEDRGSQPPDPVRDRAEMALFRAFLEAGRPIFGICRGFQLINAALGGTLVQDISPALRLFHTKGEADRVHPVRAAEGSLLYRLYGPVFAVNSAHHQVLDRLGEGLVPTAWSEAGFPEGFEHGSLPIFAVQFHPERMSFAHRRPDTVDGAALFEHLLSLCR